MQTIPALDRLLPGVEPADDVSPEPILQLPGGEFVHVGEDEDYGDPLNGGGLNPGQPAQEGLSVKFLRVTHDEVQGGGAVEAGVDHVVARIAAEVPEIDGDGFGLERKKSAPLCFHSVT